jgi:hypothetical protein
MSIVSMDLNGYMTKLMDARKEVSVVLRWEWSIGYYRNYGGPMSWSDLPEMQIGQAVIGIGLNNRPHFLFKFVVIAFVQQHASRTTN